MAKAESKTILKAYSTVESKLPTFPLEDGQLIFVYDKKKIILDNHGVRTVYEQIQTIETEEQRNDLLAPIDSFYFVIETSILWRYSNGHWNQITTSPQEQIDRIVAEGTKQVKAVQDKGTEVLQSIPEDFQTQMETKLDKQQGVENAGKVLVIGEDGNVVPEEVASSGGDGIAIINTMSGESPLVIPDSAERVNERLELGGKTEQVQTTGKNLFDTSFAKNKENYKEVTIAGSVIYAIELSLKPITKYAFQCVIKSVPTTMNVGNSTIRYVVSDGQKRVITTNEDGKLYIGFSGNPDGEIHKIGVSIVDIQVEESTTVTPYEPYTGGKPSPSPEYPQEIVNAGRLNGDTGKYEVEVTINSSNLFKVTEHTTGYYVDKDGKVHINKTLGYSWAADVNNLQKQSVTLHVATMINIKYRLYCTDLQNTILYKYEDSSTNTNDNSHTFNMPDGAKKIYVSVIEINSVEQAEITLNLGNVTLPYQPYKEQTITITSDRPLTKWDRLVEQGGQIGWLYKGKIESIPKTGWVLHAQGYFYRGGAFLDSVVNNVPKNEVNLFTHFRLDNPTIADKKDVAWLCVVAPGNTSLRVRLTDETITTASEFEQYISDKDIQILYETESTEFVPLQQSEQNAVRALKTYYPTTVITVDGGEVDPDIKVTYTADTKNYIDNKFGKTINAMQTKLLELESRV